MPLHPNITLCTKNDLSNDELRSWLLAVMDAGPDGILIPVQPAPEIEPLRFYRLKDDRGNRYIASLARDLNSEEAMAIANSFNDAVPEGDITITWSQPYHLDTKPEEQATGILEMLAVEASKKNHQEWVRTRTSEGWRFGQKYDQTQKTSPLCRPWEQLPEKYQLVEIQRMASLLDILGKMNLKIVSK